MEFSFHEDRYVNFTRNEYLNSNECFYSGILLFRVLSNNNVHVSYMKQVVG